MQKEVRIVNQKNMRPKSKLIDTSGPFVNNSGDFDNHIQINDNLDWLEMNTPYKQSGYKNQKVKPFNRKLQLLPEPLYQSWFNNSFDSMFLCLFNGFKIIEANRSAFSKYELSKKNLYTFRLFDFITSPILQKKIKSFSDSPTNRDVLLLKGKCITTSGKQFECDMKLSYINPTHFLVNVKDLSRSVKIQNELLESKKSLKEICQKLNEVRKEERSLIAREIHDEFGQLLTALKIDQYSLIDKLGKENSAYINKAKSTIPLINSLIETTKSITSNLRKKNQLEKGLFDVMVDCCQAFQSRTGVAVNLSNNLSLTNICESTQDTIYKVCQELMTNISRHAMAKNVSVVLFQSEGSIQLRVTDDGKGMTQDQLYGEQSFGLIGIRERIAFMKGSVSFKSKLGKGTSVLTKLPYPS